MREITVKLYKFDELSDEAKGRAREWMRRCNREDTHTMGEIADSVKELFRASGIKLTDWSMGPYNRNTYVSFDMGDSGDLKGKRAIAWLENNLFGPLRITRETWLKKKYGQYGSSYSVGKVKPCPFTGVCFDDDFIDDLKKSAKSGDTLKEAYRSLADKARQMMEDADEYENADEQIDESIRANEYEFTADGKIA